MAETKRKYDPVKRREYYLKTRMLKGRKKSISRSEDIMKADKDRSSRNPFDRKQFNKDQIENRNRIIAEINKDVSRLEALLVRLKSDEDPIGPSAQADQRIALTNIKLALKTYRDQIKLLEEKNRKAVKFNTGGNIE